MSMGSIQKDPDSTAQYDVEWADYLGADTLSTSSWVVPTGLTQADGGSISGTITRVKLSGGTVGCDYLVTNRVVTVGGITEDRSFLVQVRDL